MNGCTKKNIFSEQVILRYKLLKNCDEIKTPAKLILPADSNNACFYLFFSEEYGDGHTREIEILTHPVLQIA